jgi:hypothetical protein
MQRPLRDPALVHDADPGVLTSQSGSLSGLVAQVHPTAAAGLAALDGPLRPMSPAGLAGPADWSGRTGRGVRITPAGGAGPVSPAGLAVIARAVAAAPALWRHLVRFQAGRRFYHRLDYGRADASYEVWLLSWLPGQQTGFHDHGDASGAFAVAEGELLERTARVGQTAIAGRRVATGLVRSFGRSYLHDVQNVAAAPAISVHAYSPPLTIMRRYEMTPSGLALTGRETAGAGW